VSLLVDVESYFKSIGIGRPKSDGVYAKQGLKRFGEAFERLQVVIAARANGADVDPYELKNSSLDLSLYVGGYHVSSVWREYASWLVNENVWPPSQVLDLGCENGVLSCFYAMLWPNAEIIGVDQSASAIAAARELANRLNLRNVCFEQRGAREFLDANAGRFQVIAATLVMHEFLAGKRAREPFTWNGDYTCIEDVAISEADHHAVKNLVSVRNALAAGGILISLDRSPHLASKWWFAQCLEQAGMKVSLSRSYVVECTGPSGVERFPLTVARREIETDTKTTPAEIVSLATFRQLTALNMRFEEDLADTFVRSIGPTEVMFEAVCEYLDGSGTRIVRLLRAPTLLLVHDFTNHGYRTVWIAPLVALAETLAQCDDLASQLEAFCVVQKSTTEAAELWLLRLDYQPDQECSAVKTK
jgi:SAM-dependent methyltransferase